ncbi:MAG TPA: tyrosine-type recombinase/integrase [Vicinamibacteria bacterium]|nr:tyrosine-type recombinase/integrase [Vicinamibacteria bacterium]
MPRHFTMHSLRHTFCSLLIAAGVSPVYVQQQAGHADVGFAVRVYGSWFAVTAAGAMDLLARRRSRPTGGKNGPNR